MFQSLLKEVIDGVDGSLATLVMDFQGIEVDRYARPNASVDFDISIIGAEFSVVLKSIQRAAQMLEAGEPAEVTIHAEKVTTLIRVVNDTYFVALTLTPDGNLGKARYMLRTRVPTLLKELS
jgi:predicted regulator of Ras-like GTPase activity (Roadblock/LC7/MglB family)